jgi:hypothetical protein
MKRQHLPLYAIALAILVVGLAFAGVPVSSMLSGLLVLAWLLKLMFMMEDGHGVHQGGADQPVGRTSERPSGPTHGQPY